MICGSFVRTGCETPIACEACQCCAAHCECRTEQKVECMHRRTLEEVRSWFQPSAPKMDAPTMWSLNYGRVQHVVRLMDAALAAPCQPARWIGGKDRAGWHEFAKEQPTPCPTCAEKDARLADMIQQAEIGIDRGDREPMDWLSQVLQYATMELSNRLGHLERQNSAVASLRARWKEAEAHFKGCLGDLRAENDRLRAELAALVALESEPAEQCACRSALEEALHHLSYAPYGSDVVERLRPALASPCGCAAARVKQNVTQILIHERNTSEWKDALDSIRAELAAARREIAEQASRETAWATKFEDQIRHFGVRVANERRRLLLKWRSDRKRLRAELVAEKRENAAHRRHGGHTNECDATDAARSTRASPRGNKT